VERRGNVARMHGMRRVLLILALLTLAGCKEEIPRGAVKVTVTYQGFKPGCVRVLARDVDGDAPPLSTDVDGKGGPEGGALVVGVFPKDDWGTSLEVEAQAFERTCAGEVVVSHSQRVTLTPGEATPAALKLLATDQDQDGYVSIRTGGTDCNDDAPAVHPGVTEERCNGVDDNCNGQTDPVELRLGQSCTEGANCEGTRQCGDNGRVVCSTPNATLAYRDADSDGHGDKNKGAETFCNGVPAGYVTALHDDCDDGRVTVYAGAPERCDSLDNDCDGAADEDFPQLGMACTDAASQCAGTMQCNEARTATVCGVSQPIPTWYPDDDGDTYGQNPGSQQTCAPPAGFVSRGGDCDEGNPFRHPNAMELCDELDNDCDNLPEADMACPVGGPRWFIRTQGPTGQRWNSVSTWTPGGVWVVGDNNRRALLLPGQTAFLVSTLGCGDGNTAWHSVWADPQDNGRAYFGSAGGRLAHQASDSFSCTQVTSTGLQVFGLVGLRTAGTLSLHGASASFTSSDGAAFIWNGGTSVTFNSASNPIAPVYDIHGSSQDTLFAVGGYISTPTPRIYRYTPGNKQWVSENVQNTVSGAERLVGTWVVNARLAFAVGNGGSVLRWNGTSWSKLSFPNRDNLTSVVAFGASSAYATCESGHIYRYDGQNWQQIYTLSGTVFTDIAGTSPADLWVVGNNGKILHWPQ